MRASLLAIALLCSAAAPLHAGERGSALTDIFDDVYGVDSGRGPDELQLRWGAQYRPRMERTVDGNIRFAESNGSFRVTHRAELAATARLDDFRARLSYRDVRQWAPNTRQAQGDNLALNEAWVEWAPERWRIRVGVQEVTLATGRMMTAPPWAQRGRPVDGVRVAYDGGVWRGELLWARYNDNLNRDIFGGSGYGDFGRLRLGVEAHNETNRLMGSTERSGETRDWVRATNGAYLRWKDEKLEVGAEGLVQLGTDIRAYMAHVRLGYAAGGLFNPTLWIDYLSGDPDHTDSLTQVWDNSTGYRHRYYGRIDRFIIIPRDTANGGLVDFRLNNKSDAGPGKIASELHVFMLPEEDLNGASGLVGTEFDVAYSIALSRILKLTVGTSIFVRLGDYADDPRAPSRVQDWSFAELHLRLP